MLLLAADTSGRHGSIALARADEHSADAAGITVVEVVPLTGGTFSAQLVPEVAASLARHGSTKNDIGAFAVASGPGSFTGLRVGLAAIKALGETLQKPIATVSTLEAVALSAGIQGVVVAALDAGRGELYAGKYEVAGDSARMVWEQLVTMQELPGLSGGSRLVCTDNGLAASARTAGLEVSVVEPIHAGTIARVGWRKVRALDTVSPEQLEANYIRRTDAELLAKKNS
jgi:tRNA threonylcarbamoyladenosine biosynthesis protein TsaB